MRERVRGRESRISMMIITSLFLTLMSSMSIHTLVEEWLQFHVTRLPSQQRLTKSQCLIIQQTQLLLSCSLDSSGNRLQCHPGVDRGRTAHVLSTQGRIRLLEATAQVISPIRTTAMLETRMKEIRHPNSIHKTSCIN